MYVKERAALCWKSNSGGNPLPIPERNEQMQKFVCQVCDYVYDPTVGDPESGIRAGVAFEDLPDDWVCPLCGIGKEAFSPV